MKPVFIKNLALMHKTTTFLSKPGLAVSHFRKSVCLPKTSMFFSLDLISHFLPKALQFRFMDAIEMIMSVKRKCYCLQVPE